jgi:hypothetical protein
VWLHRSAVGQVQGNQSLPSVTLESPALHSTEEIDGASSFAPENRPPNAAQRCLSCTSGTVPAMVPIERRVRR